MLENRNWGRNFGNICVAGPWMADADAQHYPTVWASFRQGFIELTTHIDRSLGRTSEDGGVAMVRKETGGRERPRLVRLRGVR